MNQLNLLQTEVWNESINYGRHEVWEKCSSRVVRSVRMGVSQDIQEIIVEDVWSQLRDNLLTHIRRRR